MYFYMVICAMCYYCELIFRVWTASGDFKSGWLTRQMSLLVGPMKIWYRPQMRCITKMPGLQSRLLLSTIWQKPCMIMSWKIQSNSVWHHTSHHSIRAMVCPYLNIRTFSHFNCYRPNGLSKHLWFYFCLLHYYGPFNFRLPINGSANELRNM